jgi:hypothetical protein
MSATFKTTIERDDIEFPVTVEYNYYPGCKGARDSLGGVRGAGPPLEPDDPPELEILHVWTGDGADFALDWSDREHSQIRWECFMDVADRYQDA